MTKRPHITAGVLIAALFVLPGLAQVESDTTPEFYFTRLVYGGGGGPARTPMFDFRCADLAAGEGGTRAGGGWGTDFPASDCKFMWGVERLTNIKVYNKSPHLVTALDPKLFGYPYLLHRVAASHVPRSGGSREVARVLIAGWLSPRG